MASRNWHESLSQGMQHIDLPVCILPNGTGTPTLSEGDPKGAYVSIARTGVGVYAITTKDPFLAIVSADVSFMLAVPVGTWNAIFGPPVQNATFTWTLPFTLFLGATATDIAANANNRLFAWVRFRNSLVLP